MSDGHVFDERLSESTAIDRSDWLMHHARYLFATRYTEGLDVLDIACGTGYGSAMIARYGARHVVGVDLSEDALAEARERHHSPRVKFVAGDALDPPVTGPFDVAVSFETIEHVSEPERVLDEVTRRLKSDGMLICSTPNRVVSNPGTSRKDPPSNPFHHVELSRKELKEELESRFTDVKLYGQAYRLPGSRWMRNRHMGRAAEALRWATAWPIRLPFHPLYVVAVCRSPR